MNKADQNLTNELYRLGNIEVESLFENNTSCQNLSADLQAYFFLH